MSLVGKAYADKVLRGQVKDFDGSIVHMFPEPLQFTGAVEATYDGKKAMVVEIPAVSGENGKDGADGYTPQKGVDYYTEAEKENMVQEVLERMPASLSGEWSMNKTSYYGGDISQEVNFKSHVALYEAEDGSLTLVGEEPVSVHEVNCSKIEILFSEGIPMIAFTVESTDETLQAWIDEAGSNRLPVYMGMVLSPTWSHTKSMRVDFGEAQNVSAEFKEVFETIATRVESVAGTLTAIDFTNFENGSFTEVVDGETITHSVTFDDSGNPISIDGVTITWG